MLRKYTRFILRQFVMETKIHKNARFYRKKINLIPTSKEILRWQAIELKFN